MQEDWQGKAQEEHSHNDLICFEMVPDDEDCVN
jgi:hypothetical protein